MESCPEFEGMLLRSGIHLIKYWFSVSDEEQERRFQDRMKTPTKRWKLSPMDLESRKHWADYSRAKDDMFAHTDTSLRMVRRERRKQAVSATERHSASAVHVPVSRSDAQAFAFTPAGQDEICAPAHSKAALHS